MSKSTIRFHHRYLVSHFVSIQRVVTIKPILHHMAADVITASIGERRKCSEFDEHTLRI